LGKGGKACPGLRWRWQTLRHKPSGDNEVIGKVGGEGEGLSGIVLASAGTASQANGGDNEVIGGLE
jgi:hypothetical protein